VIRRLRGMHAAAGPPMKTNDVRAWHVLSVAGALRELVTDPARGLERAEALRRREHFGANELPTARPRSLLTTMLAQLTSPLIYLLLAASGIALVLGHRSDALVIAIVVVLNAVIGAYQEGRAERALEALRQLTVVRARVLREGRVEELPGRELVPGDLILVEGGDAVPADARLVEATALQATEAALTGESLPVLKHVRPLVDATPLAERSNMLFTGTYVAAGRGLAVVTATGLASEVGAIAALAQNARSGSTPLELRIASFGRSMVKAAVTLFALVVAIGLLRDIPPSELAMLAISQLVGMVPEGLPVAMTIALAVGVQRMARRNVIVRRLTAVETLGSTTLICTDKTGTLTRNEMTVTSIVPASGRSIAVPGGDLPQQSSADDDEFRALLEAAVLCNDAQLRFEDGTPVAVGDPTELALLALAMKRGQSWETLRAAQPRTRELPFDSATKLMARTPDACAHQGGARRGDRPRRQPWGDVRACRAVGGRGAPRPRIRRG
jgi:magnesium-transporting ATPase (P-type)